jgi:ketosteroid isomerase-like protein
MSQENVEIVRSPLRPRKRTSRTLDQRLLVRFPRLAVANSRRIAKLPPTSSLRRSTLCRASELALNAYNRRDLEAVVLGSHPDFEFHPGKNWVEAGFVEPCYYGFEGYRSYIANADEIWEGQNLLSPVELLDAGNRHALLASSWVRAQASGVNLTTEFAIVSTWENGLIVRFDEFFDHAEACAAVGLSEQDGHADS